MMERLHSVEQRIREGAELGYGIGRVVARCLRDAILSPMAFAQEVRESSHPKRAILIACGEGLLLAGAGTVSYHIKGSVPDAAFLAYQATVLASILGRSYLEVNRPSNRSSTNTA